MLTSTASIPACSARSCRIRAVALTPSPVSDGARIEIESPFTICTSASGMPCPSSVACTSSAATGVANV